ncbi:MAG: elongation factor P [SAR86 cluster bacterium]|uniref:Elongation factor P n=1 Tax=SAR86 cluster bacterium TaxID=2030880 RepID=A0A368BQV8_9GAMM|nr:MAG: elongation factor P [SAR86 cluster bacterium]|tara:strand:+ start:20019 stop:20585 length:567 start_codon:yes stop_codon:yes gene_type:complete
MKYSTNQFKQGLKILIDGEPCSINSYEFHKPGKGQAVMRTKLYNLRTEKVWERTFKSGETVEAADILEREYQYLYSEGANFIFMDQESFEQIEIDASIVGETKYWLEGEEICKMLFWNGEVLRLEAPTFVEKEVVNTEPGLKGDTVSNTLKPASISTGKEIQVPLFINEGDVIKIDTRHSSYAGRVNK